jgi:toxin YoeB
MSRDAIFQLEFLEDLRYWVKTDRRVAFRAFDLIDAILKNPFSGVGKPEPLNTLLPTHGRAASPRNIESAIS